MYRYFLINPNSLTKESGEVFQGRMPPGAASRPGMGQRTLECFSRFLPRRSWHSTIRAALFRRMTIEAFLE